MRKVSLFIAMSLDGFIADCNGNVDWLKGHDDDNNDIDTYSEFVKDIDTILMGWNTYHQIITDLSPNKWVYDDFTTFVITHKEHISSEKIRFVSTNPVNLIEKLKMENGKGIWICGGANIVQQLVNKDFIDCYYITVIPTLLGSGIRLFENVENQIELKLTDTKSNNGMVELIYVRR